MLLAGVLLGACGGGASDDSTVAGTATAPAKPVVLPRACSLITSSEAAQAFAHGKPRVLGSGPGCVYVVGKRSAGLSIVTADAGLAKQFDEAMRNRAPGVTSVSEPDFKAVVESGAAGSKDRGAQVRLTTVKDGVYLTIIATDTARKTDRALERLATELGRTAAKRL